MTTENVQTETNGVEISFDEMFKQFATFEDGEAPAKPEGGAPPAAKATTAEAPAAAAEAPPAAEEAAPAAEAPPPEETPAAPPAKAEDTATDEVLQRLARLVKEEPAPQAAPQAEQAPPPAPEPSLYTAEEQEFLQSYEKDWPDVAKAEQLRRRAEYRELVGYVFREVAKELRPIVETVSTLSTRTHLDDLRTTVTDYEDVRDKVIDWVETQPAYLQIAYKHVIQNGTVEDVADLVNRYKRETGAVASPASSTPAPVRKETELPSATKQAAASLAPVSSKRTAVVANAEPETFEDAFAMFAKT